MNFYCMGTAFLLFQLNLGWIANYAVKLVGFLLFIAGTEEFFGTLNVRFPKAENSQLSENLDKYIAKMKAQRPIANKTVRLMTAACTAALICRVGATLLKFKGWADNIVSLVLGVAVTFLALKITEIVIDMAYENAVTGSGDFALFNNSANVVRMQETFVKLRIVTFINLGGDAVNRLVPLEFISGLGGFIAAISKIVMYVFVGLLIFHTNKVRVDFNKKQDMLDKQEK